VTATAVIAAAAFALAAAFGVQQFPPASSCHVRGSGLHVLPDPRCTPGATNPAVTQATIAGTICRAGYTKSIRPPESITEPEKRSAIAAYGDYAGTRLRGYELDHLIPLELGGAANSARNLWPERDYPAVSTSSSYYLNPKDHLERHLHDLVCEGRRKLAKAQREIASDWIAAGQ
jgi:hypothetical protein